jgi:4,5-dihydroxyphthalate decarboxylase
MVAAKLKLTLLSSANDAVAPILDGTVEIEGVDLEWVDPESDSLTRRPSPQGFALHETSLAFYLSARDQDSPGWLIPVFPARRFAYTELVAPASSGPSSPTSLTGKRVGVTAVNSVPTADSAALWTRAALEHDHHVSGVTVQALPSGQDPAAALAGKTVDAVTLRGAAANTEPIFPKPIEEGARFFREHGFIPAESAYVLNADLYAEHPWIAFNVYKAFLLAKEVATKRLARAIPSGLIFGGDYLRRTRQLFGEDPSPDGVHRNRTMLEAALEYAREQGVTKNRVTLEDLFPAQLTGF